MEKQKLTNDELIAIRFILTLRYNPLFKTSLPKLDYNDFISKPSETNENEIIEKILRDIISENIKNTIPSISLSSGIDSTLIATLLREVAPEKEISAISARFSHSEDETFRASKISEELEFNHHVINIENFFEELPAAISMIKFPFWDIHWYYVAKKAKKISNLLLSGDGGDDLFCGYTFRYKKFLSLVTEGVSILDKIQAYTNCHERDWVPDQDEIFSKKVGFSWNEIYDFLKPHFNNDLPEICQIFLADYNGKLLYNWSPTYNKFHEELKIKYLAPLLDRRIISIATHLPMNLKYDSKTNKGKIILQKILKKYKTNNLVIQKKQGFSVDTVSVWQSYGQKLCNYFLDKSRIVDDGWINKNWILKYINKNDLNYRYVNKFFGLLAFEIWYRIFITKEMPSSETLEI